MSATSAIDNPDLLFGYQAIATHLGLTARQVQHQAKIGEIPTFKSGGKICSTRSALASHFAAKLGRTEPV